jgi:hypothetical protein
MSIMLVALLINKKPACILNNRNFNEEEIQTKMISANAQASFTRIHVLNTVSIQYNLCIT